MHSINDNETEINQFPDDTKGSHDATENHRIQAFSDANWPFLMCYFHLHLVTRFDVQDF